MAQRWLHDPISRLGLVNLITNVLLTLYQGYLPIYLTNNVIVSVFIFSIIISSINFFQIFIRMPLGQLSQIIGRRPMILFGNFLIDLALLLLFFAHSYFNVLLSAILIAFGMSSYWPSSFSYIQDINPSNYGKNNGRIFKFGDIGILIGALYAKIFLDQFLLDLRFFLLTLSIFGLFALIIFYFILPESLQDDHKLQTDFSNFVNENFVNMVKKFKEISTYPKMINIYSLQYILAFSDYFFVIFFPLLLEYLGYSKGTLGEIIFGAAFALLWFKPYLGGLADKFGYRNPILLSLTLLALIYCITPFVKNLLLLIVIYFLTEIFIFIGYPAVNSATASTSPIKQRGLALGTLGVYTSLGRTSSTIIMSPIWEYFNINLTFIFAGMFILAAVFILFFFTQKTQNYVQQPTLVS